ncbi:MAG: hypothetical protein D6813_01025 [Calditrichaeota bacterium]|nr:MAG: hypothetical protein D6813_01025 [Calditrichota bacterium]
MAGNTHSTEEMKKHVQIYLKVFLVLFLLTVITVLVGLRHLPVVAAVGVALFIAITKGSLVASYFMHLISETRPIFIILILTFVFLLAMFILMIYSFYDQEGIYHHVS